MFFLVLLLLLANHSMSSHMSHILHLFICWLSRWGTLSEETKVKEQVPFDVVIVACQSLLTISHAVYLAPISLLT